MSSWSSHALRAVPRSCCGSRPAAVVPWLTLLAIGCNDASSIQPGDVRMYAVPRPPETAPASPAPPVSPAPRATGLRLRYEPPDGWTDRGASGMRLATLLVSDNDKTHEVTVIPASGTLQANVDRWMGQLEPGTPEEPGTPQRAVNRGAEAVASGEKVATGDVEATVVLLLDEAAAAGPDADGEAILAAMIPVDEVKSLFVKFKGPAAIARRERDSFRRFVSSIRWN